MNDLANDYKVRRIRDGQSDGLYEITYKGSRIESGEPFITWKTAIRLMQCAIAEQRNRSQSKPNAAIKLDRVVRYLTSPERAKIRRGV